MNWQELSVETLDAAFPQLAPFGTPEPLAGGNLNYLWRVPTSRGPLIAKRAPPFAAAVPTLALSRLRLLIEARVLRLFDRAPLLAVCGGGVRPPRLLGFCRSAWLLLEEDAGPGADLAQSLGDRALFGRLGAFIASLHRETLGAATQRRRFANRDVQRARLASQYAQVGAFAERSGARDAAALGAEALALGRRWLEPGRCLVMGDLWPASVLPRAGALRIIDWEFATFGSPAQDIGHLVAHLLLLGLTSSQNGASTLAAAAAEAFLSSYRAVLGARFRDVWDEGVHRDAGLHLGCELLARAWGPFRVTDALPEARLLALTAAGLAALRDCGRDLGKTSSLAALE